MYLRLLEQRPPNPLALPAPVPLPPLDEGPHLSYAVQWFIFGSIAVIGYVVLAMRERREWTHSTSAGLGVRTRRLGEPR